MNFVIYYFKADNLSDFEALLEGGEKIGVYTRFIESLEQYGFTIYLASHSGVQADGKIVPAFKKEGDQFIHYEEAISVDILFDRSKGSHTPDSFFEGKTFNSSEFKKLASNKNQTYDLLKKYMPKSIHASSPEHLTLLLKEFPKDTQVVLKPVLGIRGKGIYIDTQEKLLKNIPQNQYPYVVQEFVDTSKGIPGITPSFHDLRFIVVNGSILMAALRTPAPGSLLANVAKGGTITEVPLSEVPENIFRVAQEIHGQLESLYPLHCYSLDFGINKNGKPFLFEINDRIGFPRDGMPSALTFAEQLALSLANFAKK